MEPPSPISPAILETMFAALQNSNVPIRRPSWNDPTFWSRPLNTTIAIPLNASATWTNILTVRGRNSYTGRVTGYVATTFNPASIALVEFRFVFNGKLMPNVQLTPNVERNRQTPTLFPTFLQNIFMLLENPDDQLTIQAMNTGVFQQLVLCAFYGWYYDNMNQAEKSTLEGLTDA